MPHRRVVVEDVFLEDRAVGHCDSALRALGQSLPFVHEVVQRGPEMEYLQQEELEAHAIAIHKSQGKTFKRVIGLIPARSDY